MTNVGLEMGGSVGSETTAHVISLMDVKETGPVTPPAQMASSGEQTAGRFTAGRIRVLLVDDHAIVREAIASILKGAGDIAVVAEVADGEAAIAAAQSLKPDVMLMDVNMPGVNGMEAARAIKKEGSSVKIVGLSIHEDEATRRAMLNAGACAYLPKTSPAEILIDTIRRCIDPP